MASTFSLLLQPPLSQFKSLSLTTPFLHGNATLLSRRPAISPVTARPAVIPAIRAMKMMTGRVVCAASDKTVAVEVTRLAPHPKYKRRVRKKKKYQAHDELNQFKVGDYVQLEKSRPISKTKAFVAIPVPPRNTPKVKAAAAAAELDLPLESQQSSAAIDTAA